MRQGTPTPGLNLIAQCVFGAGGAGQGARTLIAYTNSGDSLNLDTVVADLVQPALGDGYEPLVLDPGGWAFSAGIAEFTQPAGPNNDGFGRPCWFPTAGWGVNVTGVAMISGSIVQHFMDLWIPVEDPENPGEQLRQYTPFVAAPGRKLAVDLAALTTPAP